MKIRYIRTQAGPNVYSRHPVLVMKLDLEDLAGRESREIPGFNERLRDRLPGLADHHCALGRPGGFIERLDGGTYFGHVVEHVALELSTHAGIESNRGKTVSDSEPGCYLVAVAYKSEAGMRVLLETAVELVEALVANVDYALEPRMEEARRMAANHALGPSTRAIVDAAEKRDIPWRRMNDNSLVRLGYGRHARLVEATVTDRTRLIGVDIAGDKELTKQMLAAAALPVPRGVVTKTRDEALAALASLTPPVVVKPVDGNQGKGVSLNLTTAEQVGEAFDIARKFSSNVLVEEMYRGHDYRIVVVDGRMIAAAQRIPAHVWGDGTHAIRELIELANADPRRGDDHEKPMTKITADPIVLAILRKTGRTLDDVPQVGQQILLRESANLSTGGSARDVTDEVHPSGLGYDWSDVGVMTNLQADHLGQDGIETLDDILDIKSLLAERVRAGGTLVLNADDPMIAAVPQLPRVQRISRDVVYFTLDPDNPTVRSHLGNGGTAFVANGDLLERRHAGRIAPLVRIERVPCTLGGTARFQVGNVLAAAAACHALGLAAGRIADALQSFRLDRDSRGRLNLFRVANGHVLVDYGHNPAALAALGDMLSRWKVNRTVGIVTAPGDRSDALLEELARAAATAFDALVIREDVDPRGRRRGEIASILTRVVGSQFPHRPVETILDEIEALAATVNRMHAGDLVVALCDRTGDVLDWLHAHGATPATDVEVDSLVLPADAKPRTDERRMLAAA